MADLEKLVSPETYRFLDSVRRTTGPARSFFLWSLVLDFLAAGGFVLLVNILRSAGANGYEEELLYKNQIAAYQCLFFLPAAALLWMWLKSLFILLRIRNRHARETMSITLVEAREFLWWMFVPTLIVPVMSLLICLLPALFDLFKSYDADIVIDRHIALGVSYSLYMVGPYSVLSGMAIAFLLCASLCKHYPRALWPVISSALLVVLATGAVLVWPIVELILTNGIFQPVRDQTRTGIIVQDLVCYAVFMGILLFLYWIVRLAWKNACKAFYTFE